MYKMFEYDFCRNQYFPFKSSKCIYGFPSDCTIYLEKTESELDYNLILQYLVLDQVYSASFGSNFNQIIQLQKSNYLSTLSKSKC